MLQTVWLTSAIIFCVNGAFDNRGKEFVLAFLRNVVFIEGPHDLDIFITTMSNIPAEVTIIAPRYDPNFEIKTTVHRGKITEIQVPHQLRDSIGEVFKPFKIVLLSGDCGFWERNKGLVIQASQDITVYAINKEVLSTDAFLALPVHTLGTDYVAATWSWRGKRNQRTGIAVAATDDFTTVTFSFPPDCDCYADLNNTRYFGGDTFEIILDKYMTFLLCGRGDLTGTRITSNKPIAVFSGNDKANIPYTIENEIGSKDHLVDQLIPVRNWGREYITVSTPERHTGDYAKIIAHENGTNITYPGGHYLLQANQFQTLLINSGDYYKISATKGIMVVMFSRSLHQILKDGKHGGDPSMSILVPIPLYATDYTFATVSDARNGSEFYHYITVVIENSKKDTLMLDHAPAPQANWTNVQGSSDYVAAVFYVSEGAHNVYNTDTTAAFLGMAFGNSKYNSYAYPSGMRMASINEVCVPSVATSDDGNDNDCDARIDEEILNGLDDDGDGIIDEDIPIPPRVDGGWGLWSEWSPCPSTCFGLQSVITRQRLCNNPPPANNGFDCDGEPTDLESCTGPLSVVCPENDGDGLTESVDGQWGSWSQWSACLATCDGVQSVMTRQRMCNNPSPANNGLYCQGDGTEYHYCTGPSSVICPIDGSWSSWSSWSVCSATCNLIGTKARQRLCDNPTPQYNGKFCLGDEFESKDCTSSVDVRCIVDGQWDDWSEWSLCSATCRDLTGVMSRKRLCSNLLPKYNFDAVCEGNDTEVINCSGPVEIYCRQTLLQAKDAPHWGEWTKWSNCDVTCNRGVVTRSRECIGYNEEEGTPFCIGDSVEVGSFEMKYVCLPDEVGNLDVICDGENKQACMLAVVPCAHKLYKCAGKRQCGAVSAERLQCSGTSNAERLVATRQASVEIVSSCSFIVLSVFHFYYQN